MPASECEFFLQNKELLVGVGITHVVNCAGITTGQQEQSHIFEIQLGVISCVSVLRLRMKIHKCVTSVQTDVCGPLYLLSSLYLS
jgi:hypothetical protein